MTGPPVPGESGGEDGWAKRFGKAVRENGSGKKMEKTAGDNSGDNSGETLGDLKLQHRLAFSVCICRASLTINIID